MNWAKLPINALIQKYPGNELNPHVYQALENLFLQLTDEPLPQLNCIKDWLDHRDNDAVTGLSGAESDYYLCLDRPYACANGPFTHISQIFYVKGITPEFFNGRTDEIEMDGSETAKTHAAGTDLYGPRHRHIGIGHLLLHFFAPGQHQHGK